MRYAGALIRCFAGCDECVENREVVAGVLVAKEPVGHSTQGCTAQRSLRRVVVESHGGMAQEAAEGAVILEQVANGAPQRRTGSEASAMSMPPSQRVEGRATTTLLAATRDVALVPMMREALACSSMRYSE